MCSKYTTTQYMITHILKCKDTCNSLNSQQILNIVILNYFFMLIYML